MAEIDLQSIKNQLNRVGQDKNGHWVSGLHDGDVVQVSGRFGYVADHSWEEQQPIVTTTAFMGNLIGEIEQLNAEVTTAEAKLHTIKQLCDEGSGDPEVNAYLRNIKHIIETGEADPRF